MRLVNVRPAFYLSYSIVGLATIASLGGLLLDGLYRDNEFVTATWMGNDFATLVLAVPLLFVATILAARGSVRAQLVWIGMLDYMLYNFGFYLFGAAFNWFFFIYVAVFAMSAWTLIMALLSIDVEETARNFDPHSPVRPIAIFMMFVGCMLTIVYFWQWFGFVMSGEVPSIVALTEHPTNVVFALDLSLVVPVLVVGSVLLWRRKPWGYVLAAMGNVKGAVYMVALSAATFAAFRAGELNALSELVIWVSIGVGSTLAAAVQLKSLRSSS